MPAKRTYTCTVCGKKGFWGESWGWYGSLAHMDTCPDDVIYTCSPECLSVAEQCINSGKWRLPRIGKAPGFGVIRERKGY